MPYDGGGIGDPIDSITITPDPAGMTAEGQVQFTAIQHYTDTGGGYPSGADVDVTKEIAWLTTNNGVAVVNEGIHSGGLAFGRAAGTIQVGVWFSYLLAGPPPGPYDGSDISQPHPGETPHDDWYTNWVTLVVDPVPPPPPEPDGRFFLAFDDPVGEPYPTWTQLDDTPNLVTSYTIDRGRQYELDRTDTGRATVQIIDTEGLLDPTNPDGPWYGKLQPLIQAKIGRRNPVTDVWETRFRGFVDDYAYDVDPTQKLNRLTLSLVDLFDVVAAVEMQPGGFGTYPPTGSEGQVYYPRQTFHDRIQTVLINAGLSTAFYKVFPGDVKVKPVVYSPGESALSAVQEACDAEFPALANAYCDRRGRLICPDRHSRFSPAGTAAAVGPGVWDYHDWKAGDGAAVAADLASTAQVRQFGFSRSLSKIINYASATPAGIIDTDIPGALFVDPVSIAQYGIRSWSADNLLTDGTIDGGTGDLSTCKQFAEHYVNNYGSAANRITTIAFRPLNPDDPRAPALWEFLNGVDINDTVQVTVALPGGGGFSSVGYFVEGVHEQVQPLQPGYDDVTLTLDLSPRAYYAVDPFTG